MHTGTCRSRLTLLSTFAVLYLSGCLTTESSPVPVTSDEPAPTSNNAPTITGTPQTTITAGSNYLFTPNASDADGDALSFSVQNLPSWASFSSSSGAISGMPASGDVGVYENVIISVSDGSASASLAAFDITVTQVALGSMSLSWTPPTENTDGSALTDLAGYRIYYGTSEGNYPNRIVIDTAGISSYVVENLVPDTYFVVATSVNADGIESAFSNVAVKTVL